MSEYTTISPEIPSSPLKKEFMWVIPATGRNGGNYLADFGIVSVNLQEMGKLHLNVELAYTRQMREALAIPVQLTGIVSVCLPGQKDVTTQEINHVQIPLGYLIANGLRGIKARLTPLLKMGVSLEKCLAMCQANEISYSQHRTGRNAKLITALLQIVTDETMNPANRLESITAMLVRAESEINEKRIQKRI